VEGEGNVVEGEGNELEEGAGTALTLALSQRERG